MSKIKKYIPLLILVIIYSLLTFYKLGSNHAPQTRWDSDIDNVAILDLGNVNDINTITSYATDTIGKVNLYSYDNGWKYMGFLFHEKEYSWTRIKTEINTQYLMLENSDHNVKIGEIIIQDEHDNTLDIKNVTDENGLNNAGLLKLIDEQDIMPEELYYYTNMYFDEIYHARTAYEHINHIKPYEWVHPPLGKTIIGLGIRLFGMTPFGWRFSGAIAGILLLIAVYGVTFIATNKSRVALLSSLLYALSGFSLTMSRLATVDIYLALFNTLTIMFILMYTKSKNIYHLILSIILFGATISIKWSGLFLTPVLILIVIYINKDRNNKIKLFITFASGSLIIAIFIYWLSFLPYMSEMGIKTIKDFIHLQFDIYKFHSSVDKNIEFSSNVLSWIIMKGTLPLQYTHLGDYISIINVSGNPLVWYGGLIAIIMSCVNSMLKKNTIMDIWLLAIYSSLIVPYILVPRGMYIYHYLPANIVTVIVLAIGIDRLGNLIGNKYRKLLCGGVLISSAIMFIKMYNIFTGILV